MKIRILSFLLILFASVQPGNSQNIGYDVPLSPLYVFAPEDNPNMGILGIDDYTLDNFLFPGPFAFLTQVRVGARVVTAGDFTIDFFDSSGNFVTSTTLTYSGPTISNVLITANVSPPVQIPTSGRAQLSATTAAGQWIFTTSPPSVGSNDPAFGTALGNSLAALPLAGNPPGYTLLRITAQPNVVPTLGEWGMILLVLITFTFGAVFMTSRKMQLAGAEGNVSVGSTFRNLPFNGPVYGRFLLVTFGIVALGFAVAIFAFGYSLTVADIPGILVCSPVLAYLGYLLFGRDSD